MANLTRGIGKQIRPLHTQDAYDDLQRKKINYQRPEYVENGELICFGLSEHIVEEILPRWSEKATKDLKLVSI